MSLVSKWWQKAQQKLHKTSDAIGFRKRWLVLSLFILIVLVFIVAAYQFNWTFIGFSNKTIWDWLQLLIIPAVLAYFAYWLNRRDKKAAEQRAKIESDIAHDNQQEAILQAYFDRILEWILNEKLTKSVTYEGIKSIVSLWTRTVLRRLDADRKGYLLQFLKEAGFIGIVQMNGADLSGVELSGSNLSGADLTEANLKGAKLSKANLSNIKLNKCDLSGADLIEANLSNAELSEADLTGAKLNRASLQNANLIGAKLSKANLSDANLYFVFFSNADLTGATLCRADLSQATFNSTYLDENSHTKANLRGVDLRGAKLFETYLDEINLDEVNLDGTDLSQAYLSRSDFVNKARSAHTPLDISIESDL